MLPVNCGSHANYQNFVVENLRKYYPNQDAIARSHGISLNVFGHWIYLTLMNLCVINTLNSVQLQEHLPVCNALIFYPLILKLLP